MRIIACVLLSLLSTAIWAAEDHRSKAKDERGKRNLEYSLSHVYPGPPNSYKLERRISTGLHHPLYHSQFIPGPPRPYTSYRKDGNNEIAKSSEDLITDNNHISENVYGPHQPQIIERPVYIKEPEPIIEIIIKESNVSLPAPPTIAPPKKKKEEVQVFYVKYKKDPNGKGPNSIIYDKPIPALSPKVPDENEEEHEEPPHYHQEEVTAPPPPSTTLRTIIKPDSEVYHSPSGIKVTFGKEGFDYHKRASKPEEYNRPPHYSSAPQLPQARQLSSFSTTYFKRAPITGASPSFSSSGPPPPSFRPDSRFPPSGPPLHYRPDNRNPPPPSGPPPNFRPDNRQPQPYRPFNAPPPSSNFKSPIPRPVPPPFPPSPKYPFQSPPYVKPNSVPSQFPTQYQQTISHPPPPQFQSRKPVAYKPFESVKPQQSGQITFPSAHSQHTPFTQSNIPFRPETHFPKQQQLPLVGTSNNFNKPPFQQQVKVQQFRNEDLLQHEVSPHQLQQQQQQQQQQRQREKDIQEQQERQRQQQIHQQVIQQQEALRQQQLQQQQALRNQYQQQQILQHYNGQQQLNQNEHLSNLQHVQNVLPPGGELIHSLPKFEQHISSIELNNPLQNSQALPVETRQNQFSSQEQKTQQETIQPEALPLEHRQNQFLTPKEYEQKIQQQFNNIILQQPQVQAQFYQQQLQQQQQQQHQQQQQLQTKQSTTKSVYYTTQKPTTAGRYSSSTTPKPTTTTQEPEKPSTTTKDPKILNAQLPDEVPDDLREQLLSSGILNHADISVLDYDKVGDIPISALPPDQLANFYGAGGAQQLAAAQASGSEPIPTIVDLNGKQISQQLDQQPSASDIEEVKNSNVQMKVVHYDPETDKGQQVQEAYVEDGATQVNPVVLNDNTYNRYLPLKINGTQFPIPDVPELKGKQISSVVVLAPLTYDFSSNRKIRETKKPVDDIELIEGDALKELLKNPSVDNYKKFLESENSTRSDRQSVILLVTNSVKDGSEKEIFMYDVGTKSVSKLSGELSSAFVDAAEENSKKDGEKEEEDYDTSASNIIETRIPYTGSELEQNFHVSDAVLDESASDFVESKVPIIDPMDNEDLESQASEQLESFIDISGTNIARDDLTAAASDYNSIYTNSAKSDTSKTGQL